MTANFADLVAVIPALDEEGSIGTVVSGLLTRGVPLVIVADNGSKDRTTQVAQGAGAVVVVAARRGYGSACLAALKSLPPGTRAVVFCDGDGADDLDQIAAVVCPVLDGHADLVIGSRVLGRAEAGALSAPQRAGNRVAAGLLRILYDADVTDLGPFRCIRASSLVALAMRDPAFGWTAEMQTKALRHGLRVVEVPVNARMRRFGQSKISGRVIPVFQAGLAILSTILIHRFAPSSQARCGRSVQEP